MNKIILWCIGILISTANLNAQANGIGLHSTKTLTSEVNSAESLMIKSPNSDLSIEFILLNGVPHYRVFTGKDEIISASTMGFRFKSSNLY